MASIFDTLTSLGYNLKDYGEFWRTSASYRQGDNELSLSINKIDGFFKDFGTGDAGSFKKLLKIIVGTNDPAKLQKYLDELEVSTEAAIPKQKLKKIKVYPPDILQRLLPHYDYYLGSGISKETLETFQIGLAQSGKLLRRYCFPIYNRQNQIIGFTGRWFQKTPPSKKIPKYKHQGRTSDWIYPVHLNDAIIRECKEVILVESPNCVLHLWEAGYRNVICLFGTVMSAKIVNYLIGIEGLERIIIATNNEPDNNNIGEIAAKKIQTKLLRLFAAHKPVIHLPLKKDFGIMTPEQIHWWYNEI